MSAGDREHLGSANGNGHAAGDNGSASTSSLDAYLDGRLGGPERTAFEARLGEDPALAAGLDAQRHIDGSLRRMFIVPPFTGLPFDGHPTPAQAARPEPVHAPRAAAAVAGVAISAALGDGARRWTTKTLLFGALVSGVVLTAVSWLAYNALADRRQSFNEVYRDLAAVPAQPAGTAGFESACRHSLGHQVAVTQPPAGVEVLGVGEAKVLSPKTVVLRARVDGQNVLLFADRAANDDGRAAARHDGCSLHLFRRQVGGVVFYELTPFDEPRLLDPYGGPPTTNPAVETPCGATSVSMDD